MKEKEPWKFPDGSQLSKTALEAMGVSSGNTAQIMRQLYQGRTMDIVQNVGVKASSLLEDRAVDKNNDKFLKDSREADERREQEQRVEQKRIAEDNQDQKRYDQMTWQEKQDFDEKMIEKRRMDDQANSNILGGLGGLASWGIGLGLTGAAIGSVGNMASGSLTGLQNPQMVSSNNGGSLLGMVRGALGIEQRPGQDILLKGPEQTAAFTPGEPEPELEMGEDGAMAPAAPARRTQMAMGMPGMTPRMS